MVGIGFAAGLAEGIGDLANKVERSRERRRQAELQERLHMQTLEMNMANVNTHLFQIGLESGVYKKWAMDPNLNKPVMMDMPPAETEAIHKQLDAKAGMVAEALGAIKVPKNMTTTLPFGLGQITGTFQQPALSEEEAAALAKQMVYSGSKGADDILNVYGKLTGNAISAETQRAVADQNAMLKQSLARLSATTSKENTATKQTGAMDRTKLTAETSKENTAARQTGAMDRTVLRTDTTKDIAKENNDARMDRLKEEYDLKSRFADHMHELKLKELDAQLTGMANKPASEAQLTGIASKVDPILFEMENQNRKKQKLPPYSTPADLVLDRLKAIRAAKNAEKTMTQEEADNLLNNPTEKKQ